jgi:small subunit ribosomal protein S7
MPRRYKPSARDVLPDAKYDNVTVAKFINRLMLKGKKSVAEGIMYDAFDIIEEKTKRNPLDVFEQAIKNATPIIEVKPRRVGGATYQVPVEVEPHRRLSLVMRWLIQTSRSRSGKTMAERLANELMDASQGAGATVKKKEDTHRMAEANRAFAHYRW